MGNRALKKALWPSAVTLLLSLLAGQLASSVRQLSPTWDEPFHLLAGLRYWQAADFGINPEHPPPLKLVASIPLLFRDLNVPQLPRGTGKQEGFVAARKFLYANDANALLFRARMAAAIFALLLALVVFEAALRMFGAAPAALALALLVSEPNLLAHGALVTTDLAMAFGFFAAVYGFYRYLARPSRWNLFACGVLAGLALALKHSGILILPALALIALAEAACELPNHAPAFGPFRDRLRRAARRGLGLAGVLVLVLAIAWVVLWAFYGFRFAARPSGLRMTPPLTGYIRGEVGLGVRNPLKAKVLLALERSHLLPESYLYGLADVMIVSAGPRPTYILAKLYPKAQWSYFPATFLIKSTLAFLIVFVVVLLARPLRGAGKQREVLCLLLPALFYFAFSLTSGLNVGIRHLLPVYPFLVVLTAAGAWHLAKRRRAWAFCVAALVAWHGISSLRAYPNYLAYSNELWGGTSNTYRVLSDSNADWGQGLIQVREYLRKREIKDCWLAYFGSADPDYHGVPCKLLPDIFSLWWGKPIEVVPPQYEGTVLVSATQLAGVYFGPGQLNPYSSFQPLEPDDNIAGAILVFRGQHDLSGAHAWSRVNRAWRLAFDGHPAPALEEAQAAAEMAPRLVFARYTLGFLLARKGETRAARAEYDAALKLAREIHPEYQWFWIPFLEKLLAGLPSKD
jgi:4-amino-4-deoxy-L-arabinose transferase-like glycosyltransferase